MALARGPTWCCRCSARATRDAVGAGVDGAANPWTYVLYTTYPEQIGVFAGTGIDQLSRRMDDYIQAKKTSLDFYAFLRSSFRQNRHFDLGEAPGDDNLYDVPAAARTTTRNRRAPRPSRNRLDTDRSSVMRLIASAIRGATVSCRIAGELVTASVA